MASPIVVIVGGGFGGVAAARVLKDAPAEIVLIDRENYNLFQPLLYQVATSVLSPGPDWRSDSRSAAPSWWAPVPPEWKWRERLR
jgi:NADH dehydrogenase FAD-containing subunit